MIRTIRRVWGFFFNPVFLREIRQAVRNRVEAYALCFHLLLMVATSLIFSLLYSSGLTWFGTRGTGAQLFYGLFLVAFHGTLAAVVLHTSLRLASERLGDDLMFYSTLRGVSFTWGKFVGGVVLSLMFYSATLPFATLAYLFRGIEALEMFMLLFLSFVLIQVFNLLAIACFAGITSICTAILRGLVFIGLAGTLYFVTAMCYDNLLVRGIPHWDSEMFMTIILGGFLGVVLPVLLFFLGAAQFAPKETNRMFAFRVAATLFLMGGLAICTFIDVLLGTPLYGVQFLFLWHGVMIYPLTFLCLLPMFEREEYGLRLRKNLPRSAMFRLLLFPLYTGSCNGMIWTALMIFSSILALIFVYLLSLINLLKPGRLDYDDLVGGFSCVLMTFSYVVFSHFLWTVFLKRWISKEGIWLVTVGLLCLGMMGSIPLTIMNRSFLHDSQLLFVPYVLWGPDGPGSFGENGLQFVVSFAGFLVSCLYLFVLFTARFANFVRSEPETENEPRPDRERES